VTLRRQRSVEAIRAAGRLAHPGSEPEPESEATELGWYYFYMGQQHGPIRLELLREWHADGTLPRGLTEFWRDGDETVTSARELLGVDDDGDDDSWNEIVTDDEDQEIAGDNGDMDEADAQVSIEDGLGLEGIAWLVEAEEQYIDETVVSLSRIQSRLSTSESGIPLAELEALAQLDGTQLKSLIAGAAAARRLEVQLASLKAALAAAQAEGEELSALLWRARRAARPPPTNRQQVGNLQILEDAPADHHFVLEPEAGGEESKGMMRRAGIEWKQMSSALPAGVTVQVYESRMELLRAAIEGPADTPYEGGLFVFDIYLPPSYPAVPPKVFYWAYGKYINPNLYECGKVCLSLLGTWSGPGWDKDASTLLQLFVSIQGLILIEAPYCNEPGQQRDGGTEQATQYNRMVQAGVVDNMTMMIAAPPAGLSAVVENYAVREGVALLRRAVVLGNTECTPANIIALDAALQHPFGMALTGPVENTGSAVVGGVTEEVPRWLTVTDVPFTSGYVDDQMDDDDY
jgi:ubiquitin-protein ligase